MLIALALACTPTPVPAADVDEDVEAEQVDEDVEPVPTEDCYDAMDNDADGQVDCDDPTCWQSCDADQDGFLADWRGGTDCDDEDGNVHPEAQELCNEIDDDCDGLTDDADPSAHVDVIWYGDADGDGAGDPLDFHLRCAAGPGQVDNGYDCDDSNGAAHPGGVEVCDGDDNDCDGLVDDDDDTVDLSGAPVWYEDADLDGYGAGAGLVACDAPFATASTDVAGDCDDNRLSAHPGALEVCNDLDDDCDGIVSPSESDLDGDGLADCADPTGSVTFDVGDATNRYTGTYRYRGNQFWVDQPVTLVDFGLRIDADVACTYDSMVHVSDDPAGPWQQVWAGSQTLAEVDDAFVTSEPLFVELTPGRYYSLGVAWTSCMVDYFRDDGAPDIGASTPLGLVEGNALSYSYYGYEPAVGPTSAGDEGNYWLEVTVIP